MRSYHSSRQCHTGAGGPHRRAARQPAVRPRAPAQGGRRPAGDAADAAQRYVVCRRYVLCSSDHNYHLGCDNASAHCAACVLDFRKSHAAAGCDHPKMRIWVCAVRRGMTLPDSCDSERLQVVSMPVPFRHILSWTSAVSRRGVGRHAAAAPACTAATAYQVGASGLGRGCILDQQHGRAHACRQAERFNGA